VCEREGGVVVARVCGCVGGPPPSDGQRPRRPRPTESLDVLSKIDTVAHPTDGPPSEPVTIVDCGALP